MSRPCSVLANDPVTVASIFPRPGEHIHDQCLDSLERVGIQYDALAALDVLRWLGAPLMGGAQPDVSAIGDGLLGRVELDLGSDKINRSSLEFAQLTLRL